MSSGAVFSHFLGEVMTTEKGFTLIELMIVVAIIAILATLAFPVYRDYTVRARITEALVAITPYKVAVAENVNDHAGLDSKACADLDVGSAVTSNIKAVTCHDAGVLRVQTTDVAGGLTLDFTPTYTKDGLLTWKCELVAGSDRHVPAPCRRA